MEREKSTTILENIVRNLKNNNWKLAIAESATGGLISSTIVGMESGISSVYNGAIVSYSNESKVKVLGVKHNTLMKYGAISKHVAVEMAIGAKKAFNANVVISVTGNIGPKAQENKVIGLIYFVVLINDMFYEFEMNIPDLGRQKNRIIITQKVLEELDKCLEKKSKQN